MPCDVQVTYAEPLPIAVVRRRCSPAQFAQVIPAACGEVWQFIRASNLPHTGINLALYLDLEFNLEVGVVVKHPFTSEGPVISSATPGGRVATVMHLGPYERLGEAHQAIRGWCAARHHQLAGPFWEIYDHWNDDLSKLRTDVFYLLKEDGPSEISQEAEAMGRGGSRPGGSPAPDDRGDGSGV
jgi:effector-binding domain-containing protein